MKTKTKPGDSERQGFDSLIQRVRWAYILYRQGYERLWASNERWNKYLPGPRWDGGVNRSGQRRPNVWIKIASALEQHGIDWPEEYVAWQFENRSFHRPVLPNQLHADRRLATFVTERSRIRAYRRNRVRIELESLTSILRADLSFYSELFEMSNDSPEEARKNAMACVIGGEINSLTPLFRYAVSRFQGLDDFVEEYWVEAAFQYRTDKRHYDALWIEVLPHDAQKELSRVYTLACQKLFGYVATGEVEV